MKLAEKLINMFEDVGKDILNLSDGTMASLTGIKDDSDFDWIKAQMLGFMKEKMPKASKWQDVWNGFAKFHKLKQENNGAVDGKALKKSMSKKFFQEDPE